MTNPAMSSGKPSGAEAIKAGSHGLRGSIAAELDAPAAKGGLSESSYSLLKFHGTYEQFDRDTATALKQAGADKDWSFMVRVRAPGGIMTASQWLAVDKLADAYGDATLRLTTRQGVQFHGVIRENLRPTIAGINETLLTTLAACGDVVRNVVTTAAPRNDPLSRRLRAEAVRLSTALLPKSRAHHDLFLRGPEAPIADVPADAPTEDEPLYGPTYLPRKFKIALVEPTDNTPDVLSNDLGFIAVAPEGRLEGWIVTVGGGMGMTHNKPSTYPRIADPVALIGPDEVLEMAEAVVRLVRDHGDRSDRKHARLKYVVAEKGLDWVRARLEADLGRPLAPPPALPALAVPDHLGWHAQGDGRYWLGLPVASGRIADRGNVRLRSAVRALVQGFGAAPVVTAQQDLLLSGLYDSDRAEIEELLRGHGVVLAEDLTPLARDALACVALPTCGQALAEGERVRDAIVGELEGLLARNGLAREPVALRITGCPNGCARPYGGDIGIVGRAPDRYTIFVGGDRAGTRLSFELADKIRTGRIAETLAPLVAAFAAARESGEAFGDFCHRIGAEAARGITLRESAAA